MEGHSDEALEEIKNSLAAIMADHNARLTSITWRHDVAISNICEELVEVRNLLKNLHSGSGRKGIETGLKTPRTIKMDLPRFSGEDPQGWLYHAEEYFAFHSIGDEAKIQIVVLHMTKDALAWIQGLRRNNLISTRAKFTDDLMERFRVSAFEQIGRSLAPAIDWDSGGVHGSI